ncbi:MAG: hypothetical protein MI923_27895 [Phycisphaerales bacterium]|nr:hypothetical protein [Phycisphaerales bacterium]
MRRPVGFESQELPSADSKRRGTDRKQEKTKPSVEFRAGLSFLNPMQ